MRIFITVLSLVFCLLGVSDLYAQHKQPVIVDVFPGASGSQPTQLTNINGKLFLSAVDGIIFGVSGTGREPHVGTNGVISLLKDVYQPTISGTSSTPENFTFYNGLCYFTARENGSLNPSIAALYSSTGNIGDVTTVFIPSTTVETATRFLTKSGDFLYFSAQSSTNNSELWRSDGTTAGTIQTPEINPTVSANPANLATIDIGGTDYLFFTADTSPSSILSEYVNTKNREIFVRPSNALPSVPSTKIELNVSPTVSSMPSPNLTNSGTQQIFTPYNGSMYFIANDGTGFTLWKSDATLAGTTKIILPVGSVIDPTITPKVANNLLFFAATNGVAGRELWKWDATTTTASMVKDINVGTGNSISNTTFGGTNKTPNVFVEANNKIYFAATNGSTGVELYESNGTSAGTNIVLDIIAGTGSSFPRKMTNINGTWYYL